MPQDVSQQDAADPRVYFAAERTLLAWVRTGLALMGFGFVVARFGMFLREMAIVQGMPAPQQIGLSVWIGSSLLVLGVVVNLAAALSYTQTLGRLERAEPLRFRRLSLGVITSIALAAIGAVMAAYLVVVGLT